MLRLGSDRDVLVAVQADSDDSLATLRLLLADWIDDASAEQLEDTNPAFKVHLSPAPEGARGTRTVPHLRYGSDVLARSTDPVDVLHALASVLGGIHDRRPNDGRVWANLRALVRDEHVVLAYVPRPHLVADRKLLTTGIDELVNWGVELRADGRVSVPAPLTVRWADIDAAAPTPVGPLSIAGYVVMDALTTTPAQQLAALATASTSGSWFALASEAVESGAPRLTADRPQTVAAVLDLLS